MLKPPHSKADQHSPGRIGFSDEVNFNLWEYTTMETPKMPESNDTNDHEARNDKLPKWGDPAVSAAMRDIEDTQNNRSIRDEAKSRANGGIGFIGQ